MILYYKVGLWMKKSESQGFGLGCLVGVNEGIEEMMKKVNGKRGVFSMIA